jgi:N12 class adenine-specific DNA methylase
MAISLFPFQKEAVLNALKQHFYLLCVRVGGGKTMIAMFFTRALLNKGLIDKVVFACTVSAAVAVRGEFKDKLKMDLPQYDTAEGFLDFVDNDEKICVIKHSLFEKLGYDEHVIKQLRQSLTKSGKRIALVIDEAHKMSNDKSNAHMAYMNIKFIFERVLLMTATPYSSCLSQLYGVIHLINPKLWRNKAAFVRDHIEEQIIMAKGQVRRKEKIAYKNLTMLRGKIAPFTFFYYPKIKLNFFYHNVRLKDYSDYDDICKGVLTAKELERVEKGESEKK